MCRTAKLRKTMNDSRLLKKTYGEERSRKIRARLDDFAAADSLSDVSKLPPSRCHELTGDRAGQLAVDVSANSRLVFTPVDGERNAQGGLDWSTVTAVIIEEVVDYH